MGSACSSSTCPPPFYLPLSHLQQPFGSFLQAESSFFVRSALYQASSHLFSAGFFLRASFILPTFLLLPAALLGFYTMAIAIDCLKKKKNLHFNFFCELCLFSKLYCCYHLLACSKQVVIFLLQVFPKFIYLTPIIFELLLGIMYWLMCLCFLMKWTERQ